MIFYRNKRTRVFSGLLASGAFIALAVWGWELPLLTVAAYLAICIGALVLIVAAAALTGWLIGLLRKRSGSSAGFD